MSFKAFLTEGSTAIPVDRTIELLKEHCTVALGAARDGSFLFRGNESYLLNKSYQITSPRMRQSRDAMGYALHILNMLPSWNDIPKRNSSLIVSNDASVAAEYGSVAYVFPYDDLEIGIADNNDFVDLSLNLPGATKKFSVDSFDFLLYNMTYAMIRSGDSVTTDVSRSVVKSPSDAKAMMQEIHTFVQSPEHEELLSKRSLASSDFAMPMIEILKKKNWFEELDRLMNPKKIGVTVKSLRSAYADDLSRNASAKEAWFDGRSIVITMKGIDSELKDMLGL